MAGLETKPPCERTVLLYGPVETPQTGQPYTVVRRTKEGEWWIATNTVKGR